MAAASSRPNILLIMSDQHSRHVLGCYGNSIVRTPNLDRLASEGMLLRSAYCPAPLCVPSRMSFMTSRTPSRNRVWDNAHMLGCHIPTWAHALGAAGYETALIGRMHFVGPDQRHGFELRPIGEHSSRYPGTPMDGGPAWTKYASVATGQSRESVLTAGSGTSAYNYYDSCVTGEACRYLAEKGEGSRRPFAAVVGFLLPHNPYIAPKDLFDYYYQNIDIPEIEENQPAVTRRARENRGLLEPLPEERIRLARAAYFGLCEQFDRYVGRILEALDKAGLAENTFVIYCSDHGEMAGEHGLWAKSCYYEGAAGVPLIARWPGVVKEGASSGAACNLMDLGPTIVEAAAARPMHSVDGRSLMNVLKGDDSAHPSETFSEFVSIRKWPRPAGPEGYPQIPSRMIRSGKWKLWVEHDEDGLPPVMFDLETDPNELNDLGEDEEFADVRGELTGKLYAGWDPAAAREASIDATKSRAALEMYGKAVNPDSPDAFPFPPPEAEADIQLL